MARTTTLPPRAALLIALGLSPHFAFGADAPATATIPDSQATTKPSVVPDIAPPPAPKLPDTLPTTAPAVIAPDEPILPPSSQPNTQPASLPVTASPFPSTATVPASEESNSSGAEQLGSRLITGNLDKSRDEIAPALGARAYSIGAEQIVNIPGGENASFQQVLARAPGVVIDSFGQEHVRGEHGNLTYRINGILLPQPVNVFGQEIDTRIISAVTLIDGTLPAQYGFHTAGIVDITTKSGATLNHNEVSVYGGMYDTIQPSVQLGGSDGRLEYFVTTAYNHNGLGIENPTGSHVAIHDYTDQERLFTYLSYQLDDTSRVSLFINGYNGDFQIPNRPGLTPAFTLNGRSTADSSATNESQNEQEYYTVLAYQKTAGPLSFQASGFIRYGQITFTPDQANDLIFQGIAGAVYNNYATYGVQFDSAYVINDQHTLRFGLIGDFTAEKLGTTSSVFPAASGAQTSDVPFEIRDDSQNEATEAGIYAQDEWKLTSQLTLNYGLRYDRFDANFDHEGQFSPRVNLVWKLDDKTSAHAGYSRYFVPPPVQDVRIGSVNKYLGTTNAPASGRADPPKVEKSDYFDVGISRQITPELQIGVDGFYKNAHQLVDLGQFGSALILSPYNFAEGTVAGAELSSNFKRGGFTGFANFSWVKTLAHNIDSQEFNFDSGELTFINAHNIPLDHEAEYTISAGMSYAWRDDRVYVDMLYGSGLRKGFANQNQEQQHYPVNLGYEHIFRGGFWGRNNVRARIDLINVADQSYQLREGGGLGINASQFGQRRSVFAGITYEF